MRKNSLSNASTETSSGDIRVKHNLDREKEFTHYNNPLNRHLTTKGKIENELLFHKKPTMGSHEVRTDSLRVHRRKFIPWTQVRS